jgi:hypothetical protein
LKALPLVSVLLASTLTAGCYGRFALTRKVYTWNGQATGNAFANSLIMWGLLIIPVYELAGLADLLIFNTIEVFTGSNPVAQHRDGSLELDRDGKRYVFRPVGEDAVQVEADGAVVLRYERRGERIVVQDAAGATFRVLDAPQELARASVRGGTF